VHRGPKLADPVETFGTVPDRPLPFWGWGDIPDQYGHLWNGDHRSAPMPPAPDGLPISRPSGPGEDRSLTRTAGHPATLQRDH
jgi:hypothetical protein